MRVVSLTIAALIAVSTLPAAAQAVLPPVPGLPVIGPATPPPIESYCVRGCPV